MFKSLLFGGLFVALTTFCNLSVAKSGGSSQPTLTVQSLDFSHSSVPKQANLSLNNSSTTAKKAMFHSAWALKNSDKLVVDIALPGAPIPFQIGVEIACIEANVLKFWDKDSCPNLQMSVDSSAPTPLPNLILSKVDPTYSNVFRSISASELNTASTSHSVTFSLKSGENAEILVKSVTLNPSKIYSQNGELNVDLYAQFGQTETVTGTASTGTGTTSNLIWTRAYGLADGALMISAPTLHFNPGDLVNITLHNKLSGSNLEAFEAGESTGQGAKNSDPDEILDNAADKLKHEVNIPHNLNNTNLHMHGLHVDPDKEDVTIVIVPEGESATGYDAPDSDTPTINKLDEGSVSDQSIKPGHWPYQYRIPTNHLPGTLWYHPHKHGSTAAQLENGMAGSIVIQENANNAVVPYPGKSGQPNYIRTRWENQHDRVLMIQEIANYGTTPGSASGGGSNSKIPDITINGLHQPTLSLAPGQLERWRLIGAGANHRTFSHIWLGEDTGKKDGGGHPIYTSATMHVVALDGITLSRKLEITAQNPLLLAPGNRADVLVQFPDKSANRQYALFKYYPNDISISENSKLVWNCSNYKAAVKGKGGVPCSADKSFEAVNANTSNPYIFAQTGVGGKENFAGFTKNWYTKTNVSTMPLIKVKPKEDQNFLDVNFALTSEFTTGKNSAGKWQPTLGLGGLGGGATDPQLLMNVSVSGSPVAAGSSPNLPNNDEHLKNISPTGNMKNTPAYVSQFEDKDILQSRPLIFDLSGASVAVVPKGGTVAGNTTVTVRQFTLNGRPFALNDPIGNNTDAVTKRLQEGFTDNTLNYVNIKNKSGEASKAKLNIIKGTTLNFVDYNKNSWSNSPDIYNVNINIKDKTYYWTNPSYYQEISVHSNKDSNIYQFGNNQPAIDKPPTDKPPTDKPPTDKPPIPSWQMISGIKTPSIVNYSYAAATASKINGIPGKPVATTGEEWILINNSDIGHPFHIHINPFFVTEVGQLSYEQFSDKKEWIVRAMSTNKNLPSITKSDPAPTAPTVYQGNSTMPWVVGNWLDTVLIPPHGYVKVKYWINVPKQSDDNSTVIGNYNKDKAVWVFHCHILRHEDRGMMMPIITQKMTLK